METHELAALIEKHYATLGFKAKVKVTDHIAKTEFCNMIFAPVQLGHLQSLTLIAKPARLMLKFNGVARSSITTTVEEYVYQNLVAIKNTLQFYPKISCYHNLLAVCKYDKRESDKVELFKTPKHTFRPNFSLWNEYCMIRYGISYLEMSTDAALMQP